MHACAQTLTEHAGACTQTTHAGMQRVNLGFVRSPIQLHLPVPSPIDDAWISARRLVSANCTAQHACNCSSSKSDRSTCVRHRRTTGPVRPSACEPSRPAAMNASLLHPHLMILVMAMSIDRSIYCYYSTDQIRSNRSGEKLAGHRQG